MKEAPNGFVRRDAIYWACAILETYFGTDRLDVIPSLMSGYGSILDHPAVEPGGRAFDSLRRLGAPLHSMGSIRRAIQTAEDAQAASEQDEDRYRAPPYRLIVEGQSYRFERRFADDDRPKEWAESLAGGLQNSAPARRIASIENPFTARTGKGGNARVMRFDLTHLQVTLPEMPQHDLGRRPAGPHDIPFDELLAIAREFDAMDAADPARVPGRWEQRFRDESGAAKVELLEPNLEGSALVSAGSLRLTGIKHLIGLPGAGKSTLIALVTAWLARRGLRLVILVPSIVDAMKKIAEFRSYGIHAALLAGQSGTTRQNHARRFVQKLGATDGHGFGLADEPAGSSYLATGCALEAYDDDPADDREFPRDAPPCSKVEQDGRSVLCPLAGWCGRMEAQRALTAATVWIGHILSLDTKVPPHFCAEDINFLELVAKTADLVIVDEADEAQHVADARAITRIDVVGTTDSIQTKIIEELHLPYSSGQNGMTSASVETYSNQTSTFSLLSNRIVMHLQQCRQRQDKVLTEFEKGFLTGNRVAASLFGAPESEEPEKVARFSAIAQFIETAVAAALFGRDAGGDVPDDRLRFDPTAAAQALGRSSKPVKMAWMTLRDRVAEWIRTDSGGSRDAILAEAQEAVFRIAPPKDDGVAARKADHAHLFRFLIETTSVVLQFLAVTSAQRAMVSEGVHKSVFFEKGMSSDFVRSIPEALMGRLSGLSFEFHGPKDGEVTLSLSYMVFRGAPRIALHRLNDLYRHDGLDVGPAVLLASATSYLKDSPSYHVDVGPHYILRRVGGDEQFRRSTFLFQPLDDPNRRAGKLFFSGARTREDRLEALRIMARHFFSGADPNLARLNRTFDEGRMTGFVVNGYDQVVEFKKFASQFAPERARRLIAVHKEPPPGNQGDWLTPAQVESLGERNDWDAVVFPMKSLARGVNIVWKTGPRKDQAALDTIVFLTRPHPASESTDFIAGLVGQDSQSFDRLEIDPGEKLPELVDHFRTRRAGLLWLARSVLTERLLAIRLSPKLERKFTADLMVDFIQTMGRGIRDGCRVRVVFVDAAWSRGTAAGGVPTAQDSTLVMMRDILRGLVRETSGAERETYALLYEAFLQPLERCEGLFPAEADAGQEEDLIDA